MAKTKTLTSKQIERACVLVKCRQAIWDALHPPKRKRAKTIWHTDSAYSVYHELLDEYPWTRGSSEHRLPADLVRKMSIFLIKEIDAELATLGVTA